VWDSTVKLCQSIGSLWVCDSWLLDTCLHKRHVYRDLRTSQPGKLLSMAEVPLAAVRAVSGGTACAAHVHERERGSMSKHVYHVRNILLCCAVGLVVLALNPLFATLAIRAYID
jgi:hypothetical protein